jgi:hypothetical protein
MSYILGGFIPGGPDKEGQHLIGVLFSYKTDFYVKVIVFHWLKGFLVGSN